MISSRSSSCSACARCRGGRARRSAKGAEQAAPDRGGRGRSPVRSNLSERDFGAAERGSSSGDPRSLRSDRSDPAKRLRRALLCVVKLRGHNFGRAYQAEPVTGQRRSAAGTVTRLRWRSVCILCRQRPAMAARTERAVDGSRAWLERGRGGDGSAVSQNRTESRALT